MSSAVQKAIQAAKEQATNAVVASTPQQNAVASYVAPQKKTLDDLDTGLQVDGFIQPKYDGMKLKMSDEELNKGTTIIEEMYVITNLSFDATVFTGAKYGNTPTVYIKTYDGVKEARGGSWAEAFAKAKLADPTVYEYNGADVEFTVAEDIKDLKGKVVAKKGQKIGHTTTPTGLKNFKKLIKQAEQKNLKSEDILVKITNEPISKGGNNWGVLKFELVGAAPELELESDSD